jgi:hypothetical protein
MDGIKALIRNGRVEPEQPLELPEGTEVLIVPAHAADDDDDDGWDNSPEGIAAWLEWYRTLEPLQFTPEEKAALEADRAERKAWELQHFDERMDKLRKMWE